MKKVLLFFCILQFGEMEAQALLREGMTVVANFPADTANDYSLHVYDTRNVISIAPTGINWPINTLLPSNPVFANQWKFARMGQIFGVTIDKTGNIYASAGNVYNGYPGNGGSAGWGGIYKVDAFDWSVSDFVTTDIAPASTSATQIPNTGHGLGNITYDKWHDQLFATNFEDGKIYRISMSGTILNTFDPFLPDDGTSAPAPNNDRPWGVAVYQDNSGNARLYFSNWSQDEYSAYPPTYPPNTIWSIPLDQYGNFTGTAQLEITMPEVGISSSLGFSNPVSCINFSSVGKMLLAERSMSTMGNTSAHLSRCFEYIYTAGSWTMNHVYQVGNTDWSDGAAANSSGGADFGFADDDPTDTLNGCEQLIWGTGDALRAPLYNPDNLVEYVFGLTGIPETGNSLLPASSDFVCSSSYYIDLDNNTHNVSKTSTGSCAVFRDCIYDPCEKYSCTLINVLTPNEDGVNDKFRIDCIQTEGWSLEVYDRRGVKVFANKNYQNDWDCHDLVEGVYYYILMAPCDGEISKTGFFHLLR